MAPIHAQLAMRTHLAGCAACAEEARSLLCYVAEQDGLNPEPALQRLENEPACGERLLPAPVRVQRPLPGASVHWEVISVIGFTTGCEVVALRLGDHDVVDARFAATPDT